MIVLYWMTPDPFVVKPDTDLATTWQLLMEKGIRRVPVVDGDEIKGIVGRSDILAFFRSFTVTTSQFNTAALVTVIAGVLVGAIGSAFAAGRFLDV